MGNNLKVIVKNENTTGRKKVDSCSSTDCNWKWVWNVHWLGFELMSKEKKEKGFERYTTVTKHLLRQRNQNCFYKAPCVFLLIGPMLLHHVSHRIHSLRNLLCIFSCVSPLFHLPSWYQLNTVPAASKSPVTGATHHWPFYWLAIWLIYNMPFAMSSGFFHF